MKECTACKRTLPNTAEFFHPYSGGKKGLRNQCRDCRNAQRMARYKPHPKPVRVSADGTAKTCTRCGETKPLTLEYWYKAEKQPGGVMAHCKSCHNGMTKRWKQQDTPAVRAWRERTNARLRTPEGRARANAISRRWWANNAERGRARSHEYRARKMAAPGRHTAEDVKRQLASQNGLCYWCQQPLETHQVDHLIPLARGGSNGPENIVCACQSCNSRKHAKMPWEFAGRLL